MQDRRGKKKDRNKSVGSRKKELENYLIVTDTKKTENNYFNGLKSCIPENMRSKIIIKTKKADTKTIVEDTLAEFHSNPQYTKPCIVFDRDRVTNFDEIIKEAKDNSIFCGWSNPCIEIWFFCYFKNMPTICESKVCCTRFSELFQRKFGQEYDKADADIFDKLKRKGNLSQAIKRAEKRDKQFSNDNTQPSECVPCTKVYEIVKDIVTKANINLE